MTPFYISPDRRAGISFGTTVLAVFFTLQVVPASAIDWGNRPAPAPPPGTAAPAPGAQPSAGNPPASPPARPSLPAKNLVQPAPISPAPLATAPAPEKESWPQSFKVSPGEKVAFGFPVGQPGAIVVNVQWQGAPLTITLKDPSGKTVTPSAPQPGAAATVTHNVSSADLQKGFFWVVSLAGPPSTAPPAGGTSPTAVATGTVAVTHPPADPKQVEAQSQAIRSRRLSAARADQTRTAAVVQASLQAKTDAYNRSRQERFAALERQLKDRIRSATTPHGVVLMTPPTPPAGITVAGNSPSEPVLKPTAAAAPTASLPAGLATPGGKTGLPKLAGKADEPSISEVNPPQGSPGDRVVIRGTNLKPDEYSSEVFFIINPGTTVQAKVLSATAYSYGVDFEVRVPNAAGVTQGYDGIVYMKAKDRNFTTRSLPFRFDPVPKPTIVSIDPPEGKPGDWVVIDGNNFKSGDQVHFVLDPTRDFVTEIRYGNGNQVQAKVPSYVMDQPLTGGVYFGRQYATGWSRGASKSFLFKSTVPFIQSISPNEGEPGQPVLLTGSGFSQGGELHFRIGDKDMTAKVTSWADTQILALLPDIAGIPIGGISGFIYIKTAQSSQSSSLTPFVVHPRMEYRALNPSLLGATSDIFITRKEDMDVFVIDPGGPNIPSRIFAAHTAGMFFGHGGDDHFFMTKLLKNGWVVDSVDFDKNNCDLADTGGYTNCGVDADAIVVESRIGTDSPYVKVHWWNNASFHNVTWLLTIIIKGPSGIPYY